MTGMTVDELDEVFRLFEDSAFDELTIESGEFRVHVTRGGIASSRPSVRPGEDATPAARDDPATDEERIPARRESPQTRASQTGEPVTREDANAVKALVSGTFYRSPSPTAEPFVAVGDRVRAADTVGLIEVMKLFTSIVAGSDGEVVEILVDNGAPVQAGDVLMRLRPAGDPDEAGA